MAQRRLKTSQIHLMTSSISKWRILSWKGRIWPLKWQQIHIKKTPTLIIKNHIFVFSIYYFFFEKLVTHFFYSKENSRWELIPSLKMMNPSTPSHQPITPITAKTQYFSCSIWFWVVCSWCVILFLAFHYETFLKANRWISFLGQRKGGMKGREGRLGNLFIIIVKER